MPKEINLTGDQVVSLTRKYLAAKDVAFVQKALVYAIDRHSGQTRQSQEPYIVHPIQVAGILAKLKLDAVSVACGFCTMWLKTLRQRWMIWSRNLGMMCA